MYLFIIFLFGISIGSFLNVLVDRLPKNESPFGGRSHCEHCKHKLSGLDLIPLLSFFLLKGKCRYCHKKLSYYYPVVELTTGILFAITAIFALNNFQFSIFNFQSNLNFQISIFQLSFLIFHLFLISSLIVIFFTDIKYGIIPDKITYPAILISFLFLMSDTKYLILNTLPSAVGAFLFFFLLFVVTRGRGMGFGDVKYAFLMGLVLGFPNIITALYIAFLTGALISLILVVWGKKKLKGTTIPFGPFLVLGTVVCLFWGDTITQYAITLLFH